MAVLETIKALFAFGPGPAVKQFSTNGYSGVSGEAFGPLGQRNADWSSVADMPRIQDAYRKCSVAYACVTLLADAVAESPLRVYQSVDGDLEELPDHRLRTLLANPNPLMSEAEFMSLIVMAAGMWGYALVEKVRSGANLPVELWPLRPDWMVRDRSGWVYRVPGREARPVEDEDLIIVPYRHDEKFSKLGVSPLQIVAREIGIDVNLTDLLKVFIDSGGIPPWVVKFTGDIKLDQAKKDLFRLQWRQMFGGKQAYQNVGVLDPGMDLIKVGDSIGDMAWPDLRGLTEMKICQAFRVPADLVQARDAMSGGSLTTTEMTGAMAFLQNHGAQPLRMRIDGAFSRGLLADFGLDSTYSLEFDTDDILALQEDEDALHMRWRANYDSGLATWNEARQAVGLPDIGSDGDVVKVSFTTVLQPVGGSITPNGTERASASIVERSEGIRALSAHAIGVNGTSKQGMDWEHPLSADPIPVEELKRRGLIESRTAPYLRHYRYHKAMSPVELEKRASVLTTTRRERDKLAQQGARHLRKFFKDQGARIVGALPKSWDLAAYADHKNRMKYQDGYWGRDDPEGALWWAAARDVQKAVAVDWDEEDEILRTLMDKFYGTVGDRAFGTAAATLGVDLEWTLANPNVARVMDKLGQRIVGISEQTRQDVIARIAAGQSEGLSLPQIADSIRDMFETTYTSRADAIARTETQVSYNLASQLGYQESGVVDTVEMVDNPDHTESYDASDGLTCAERDGMVVNIGQMDVHVDAEHPNGSLAFIPILSTPLGE